MPAGGTRKAGSRGDAVDAAEDAESGKDQRGDEITDELLRNPRTRLARIKQLRAELEAEAAQQREAAAERDNDDDPPPTGAGALPSHQIPMDKQGKPTPKAQRNFTDSDSRIMKAGGDYVQAYNCQVAVDDAHQIVVSQLVTNQPPDVEHLPPVLATKASTSTYRRSAGGTARRHRWSAPRAHRHDREARDDPEAQDEQGRAARPRDVSALDQAQDLELFGDPGSIPRGDGGLPALRVPLQLAAKRESGKLSPSETRTNANSTPAFLTRGQSIAPW